MELWQENITLQGIKKQDTNILFKDPQVNLLHARQNVQVTLWMCYFHNTLKQE